MFTARQSAGALGSLAIIGGIAGAVGYGVGVGVGAGSRMSETKVFRDVTAQAGDGQMTAVVDNVAYGVSGESPGLTRPAAGIRGAGPHAPPREVSRGSHSGAQWFMARQEPATTGWYGWTLASRGHADTPR